MLNLNKRFGKNTENLIASDFHRTLSIPDLYRLRCESVFSVGWVQGMFMYLSEKLDSSWTYSGLTVDS